MIIDEQQQQQQQLQQQRILYKRSRALREYVASFHLFTMFIGLAVTSIGAYLINSNTSKTVSISLLILGVMITTTGFIGCFGAHLEHTSFLNTYSSISAIALILEMVLMGLVYTHQSQLDNYASMIWDFFHDKDPQFLLDLEKSATCCGYASIEDRSIPEKTCSILLGAHIGCRESIVTHIQQQRQWITIIILFLLSIQLIALLFSVIVSYIIDHETREEETYMSLLSSSYNNNHNSNEGLSSCSYSSASPNYINNNNGGGYFIVGGSPSRNINNRPISTYNQRKTSNSIPKYGSTTTTNTKSTSSSTK